MSLRKSKRQRGAVAVEAAIVIPVLLIVMAVPLYLARFFWHYTTAQKAAHDAALYLSRVSQIEMKTIVPSTGEVAAASLARQIAAMEMSELNTGNNPPNPQVLCGYPVNATTTSWAPCDGLTIPTTVKVSVRMYVTDPFFSNFTSYYAGDGGLFIWAEAPMQYVGG